VYYSGFSNVTQATSNAGMLNNLTFLIYPVFILGLSLFSFIKTLKIGSPSQFLINFRSKLHEIRLRESMNMSMVYTVSFILMDALFFVGIVVPMLFGSRILEIVCIGLYPFAAQSIVKLTGANSKWQKVLIYLLLFFVVFSGIYRYYSQIQRRVIIG
jgi:hypothetical protein